MNIQSLEKLTQTKFKKRSSVFESSNFSFNPETKEAFSYNWWKFSTVHNGVVIFNNTRYSNSTCKHQGKAMKFLDYDYDIKLIFTRKSLSDMEAALNDEIQGAKREIASLITKIKAKGTRKSTNLERTREVTKLIAHINQVRRVLGE